MPMISMLAALLLLLTITSAMAQSATDAFAAPTTQTRPWTRWWWMGSAVDEQNIARELRQLKDAGFGGVEITPLYGAVGYEDRYIDFLSPRWMAMLRFTCEEARKLGLGVDMATGTGWPFGGPWIDPDHADALVVLDGQDIKERPTRMKVKRAAPGDEGWVVNPYSTGACETYLSRFTKAFEGFPRELVRAQFHDSFEYAGNWSRDLPEKFRQMHGYDLRDHATEFAGRGEADLVTRVQSDYRQTLAQMHLDYINTWVKWSHDHGFQARNQAHGSPGNLLDLYAAADIGETESFGSTRFSFTGFRSDEKELSKNIPNFMVSKMASSAMNVSGKNIATCETFTWLREHFRGALSQMKPEADWMFLAGINHLFYHGTCYSPTDAPWPGWNFYASTEFNAQNTLWRDLSAMNAYYARCQSILQSGTHSNDILLYWPIFDLYATQPHKSPEVRVTMHTSNLESSELFKAANWLTSRGYSFDFVSDAQLQSRKSIAPYRMVLVPRCRFMPVQTLQKLAEWTEAGVSVLFVDALPADVPGLNNLTDRRRQFSELLSHFSRMQVGTIDVLLSQSHVRREAMVDCGLRFIRRRNEQSYSYFLVNLTDKPIARWIPLASACQSVQVLDPMTGRSGKAPAQPTATGTSVFVQIDPGESYFLRTSADDLPTASPWNWTAPAGEAFAVEGEWNIEFVEGGPDSPGSFKTSKLVSWTELGGAETRRFAGAARYTIEFEAPGVSADAWELDLGDVRESARVSLNGESLGTAWAAPMRLRIDSTTLKKGKNLLSIEVTNLAANRIRDLDKRGVEWRKFHEINFVNIHYEPFDASTWPVIASGLLGPVRLIPQKIVR